MHTIIGSTNSITTESIVKKRKRIDSLVEEKPNKIPRIISLSASIIECIYQTLPQKGMTNLECIHIEYFYRIKNKYKLPNGNPQFLKRGTAFFFNGKTYTLPRSVSISYIGLAIFFKTHGNIAAVGYGGFNAATQAICIDTQKKLVFRSGKKTTCTSTEVEVSEKAVKKSSLLAGAIVFEYRGPFRSRLEVSRTIDKTSIPRELNVEKMGFLLKFYPLTLLDVIDQTGMSLERKITLITGTLKALSQLHEMGYIHRDLKPANVFLDENNTPILGDFGLAKQIGLPMRQFTNNPEYYAPELIVQKQTIASPSVDIWGIGYIAACLFGKKPFFQELIVNNLQPNLLYDGERVEADLFNRKLHHHFPEKDLLGSSDHAITSCLNLHPHLRPTIDVAMQQFQACHS